jgi:hypothetical protein
MFAAMLVFGLTLGSHKAPCSAPLYTACANSRQLISNKDFQATLRRFLGDREGNYRRGTRLIYKEVAERLREPKGPPLDIGAGARLFAGCRFTACPEKAAVILDRTGVLAVGVVDYHSDFNPSLEVDVQRSGPQAAAEAAALRAWANRAVAEDAATQHAPIALEGMTVRALREEKPGQQAALQAKSCSRLAALIHHCRPG